MKLRALSETLSLEDRAGQSLAANLLGLSTQVPAKLFTSPMDRTRKMLSGGE